MRTKVQSLALLSVLKIQHCHKLWCRSKMRLRSCIVVVVAVFVAVFVAMAVAVAGSCHSNLTPSLGTSICLWGGPKKTKKKKKRSLQKCEEY